MHVFNNCGAVNSRGLLLSRQKRGPSSASAGRQQRIAEGSTDLREARLHRLRVNQQHRLAFQCPEETEARRAHDRQNHMPMDTAEVPLFHQPRVLSKMVQFYSRLASLQILKCITCLERFLGITVSYLLVYLCNFTVSACAKYYLSLTLAPQCPAFS